MIFLRGCSKSASGRCSRFPARLSGWDEEYDGDAQIAPPARLARRAFRVVLLHADEGQIDEPRLVANEP